MLIVEPTVAPVKHIGGQDVSETKRNETLSFNDSMLLSNRRRGESLVEGKVFEEFPS